MRSSPTTADAREDADLPADKVGQAFRVSFVLARYKATNLRYFGSYCVVLDGGATRGQAGDLTYICG